AVHAIVNVNDAPGAIQALAILASVTGAASIIHIQHSKSAAGPKLSAKHQHRDRGGSWSAMALHQQRWFFVRRRAEIGVLWSIEKGVSRAATLSREFYGFCVRDVSGIELKIICALQNFLSTCLEIEFNDRERLGRRAGAEDRAAGRSMNKRYFGVRRVERFQPFRVRVDGREMPDAALNIGADDSIFRFESECGKTKYPKRRAKLSF